MVRNHYFFAGIYFFVFISLLIGGENIKANSLPDKVISVSNISASSQNPPRIAQRNGWRTYTNARYRFKIDFPIDWYNMVESDNGDGVRAYYRQTEKGVDIRAFASPNLLVGNEDPYAVNTFIRLDSGEKALQGISKRVKGKVVLRVDLEKTDVVYTFFADIPESYYIKNKVLLLQIAKTLRAP